jgi:hypothetical protein
VAETLKSIPIGGWPTGIVGRRDAAIVVLICAAGLTRAQVQALHSGSRQGLPRGSADALHGRVPEAGLSIGECPAAAVLKAMPRTDTAGTCPACALSRWLRVVARLDDRGWRTVRAELADYGEVPASDETSHDCALMIAPPATSRGREIPLFCAIDRHGAPETGYPLSIRSITAVVAGRLHAGEQAPADDWQPGRSEEIASRAAGGRRWGAEDRRRVAERFATVGAALDDMEADDRRSGE